MDFMRKKSKKRQPNQHDANVKPPSLTADLKTIKENLKIKEILRTVKINSSMRIKAPRGSKVMSNKDLTEVNDSESTDDIVPAEKYASNPEINCTSLILDNEDLNKQETDVDTDLTVTTNESAGDLVQVDVNNEEIVELDNDIVESTGSSDGVIDVLSERIKGPTEIKVKLNGKELTNQVSENDSVNDCAQKSENCKDTLPCLPSINNADKPLRVRKLSLDQTMLSRRASSLSQSEIDLHIVGKLPLERKSSFFRKKMENFVENTSKIFKRQSMTKADGMQRRGSMSFSLQSLNDKHNYANQYLTPASSQDLRHGSVSSLNSASTVGNSESSQCGSQANSPNLEANQPSLSGSQPYLSAGQFGGLSESVHSLSESYIQEHMLSSRAISMSSGLDTATGTQKRSRANRVTWLASEGLTNYLRRVIQDETSKEDSRTKDRTRDSRTKELRAKDGKTDSRGRRLSYQRAVSGEDPVRFSESSLRRRRIPELCEANYELANVLGDFAKNGIPPLQDLQRYHLSKGGERYLQLWTENTLELQEQFHNLPSHEVERQAVLRELVYTEATYIADLRIVVESYMAAALALQNAGWLLDIDTERVFVNFPDLLNATLLFWERTIVPMLDHAEDESNILNSDMMYNGFFDIREIYGCYDHYLRQHSKMTSYLIQLRSHRDFNLFSSWCKDHFGIRRLSLSDMLSKPMQRLLRYSLILKRIASLTDTEPCRTNLIVMETSASNFAVDLNRSIRQQDELANLQLLVDQTEPYDLDFKDDDMDRIFKSHANLDLQAPMIGCAPHHSRCIILDKEIKFKDNIKEMDARAILLTDMILIVKRQSKGTVPYKMVRPKYMLNKLTCYLQLSKNKNSREFLSLIFISVDDFGSAQTAFAITDPTGKDDNLLKSFENKFREAKLTYELGVWCAKNPSKQFSDTDYDSSAEYFNKTSQLSETKQLEKNARDRVATMLHCNVEASTEYDFSLNSIQTDSFDVEKNADRREKCENCPLCERCEKKSDRASAERAAEKAFERAEKMAELVAARSISPISYTQLPRTPNLRTLRHAMKRHSTASSRISRTSSLHHSSTSPEGGHEHKPALEPIRIINRNGSIELHRNIPADAKTFTTITVNVLSDSESESLITKEYMRSQPPSRSSSSTNPNTLQVQPQDGVMALIHSLPDLSIDPTPRPTPLVSPQSASERMYQSHHDLLEKNRLMVSSRSSGPLLSPDNRGISYPLPGPLRGSLTRSLAFSESFHYPHLTVDDPVSQPAKSRKNKGGITKQQMKKTRSRIDPESEAGESSRPTSRAKSISEDQRKPTLAQRLNPADRVR